MSQGLCKTPIVVPSSLVASQSSTRRQLRPVEDLIE